MSCGLIFFTNDGGFAARLGHPSSGIEKEYVVEATGHIPDVLIETFEKGITIEDERYKAQFIERLDSRTVRVVLIEGKNREIRRVFSHFHLHPFRLRRTRIGPVKLGELEEGKSRPLTKFEVEALIGSREKTARVPRSDSRNKTPVPSSQGDFVAPPVPKPRRGFTW
jgi:23S rRNA pseudouridine2605 synthase